MFLGRNTDVTEREECMFISEIINGHVQ